MLTRILILLAALLLTTCQGRPPDQKQDTADPTSKTEAEFVSGIQFTVEGMTCTGCENAVTGSIGTLDGIVSAEASHTEKNTVVTYDSTLVSVDEISQAIIDAGYKVVDYQDLEQDNK